MSSSPFRRILVPIDFTEEMDESVHAGFAIEVRGSSVGVAPASAKALQLAAGMIATGGELCLVHATPSYEAARVYNGASRGVLGPHEIAEIHADAANASIEVLDALARRFAPDVEHRSVARPGTSLHVILAEATSFDAQLVVIAASGRGRVARFFLGSTADRVIRESPCPVMVVPPQH